MPTLFFMPWAKIKAAVTVGPVTFLPYERGHAPGSLGPIKQAMLDAVIGNYADRAFFQDDDSTVPVKKAIILRWPGDDELQEPMSADHIQERLQQIQLFVFAAVSARLYGGHWEYCNSDDLLVTAQSFSQDFPASTAIQSRRRDGRAMSAMAGTIGKPVFLRPMHVHTNYSLDMDWQFALALLSVPAGEVRDRLMVAVTMFVRANTDANEVPASAEAIFMRAALETLVDAGHTTEELKAKLGALINPHLGPVQWHDVNIPPSTWQRRWWNKKEDQPPNRPFTAWIADFCHWRNEGAHGKSGRNTHAPPVWSLANHLMFASWFMSSVVKCFLSVEGYYTLTEEDSSLLANTEMFFTYDVSELDGNHHLQWHHVLNQVESLKLGNWLRVATSDWPSHGEAF